MIKNIGRKMIIAAVAISLAALSAFAADSKPKKPSPSKKKMNITVRAIGPTEAVMEAARARVLESRTVQAELTGKKFFLVSVEYIENGSRNPTDFRAVIVDHSDDRTLVVNGDFAGRNPLTVQTEAIQPVPSDEEFDAAVAILRADSRFASSFDGGSVIAFRPMPPISVLDGTTERLVNVGMDGKDGNGRNEVVSVSIKRGEVIRYPENAPPSAVSSPEGGCGVPSAGQSTTSNGTAGQFAVSTTLGGQPLWEMTVVRPSASSGHSSKRSAIEVRDVKWKGKSVLKRGHVPILNVQYVGGQCGPYRDWQYQEDMFATPGTGNTDPAPGVRVMAAGNIPTTALETGVDSGNFKGVAIYEQGNELVLVSELQAGWYRYISEWRFTNEGVIRPRFGFGATNNNCVCFAHNHHVYWRLDFDIVNPINRVTQVNATRGVKPPLETEMFTNKDVPFSKNLVISNPAGFEAYMLVPNATDGLVDTYGVHDMWVLQYKHNLGTPIELEDGVSCVTCQNSFIQIDPFVNGESVKDQDIVVWYGAHFLHNDGANLMDPSRSPEILSGSHVVGPDLVPGKW